MAEIPELPLQNIEDLILNAVNGINARIDEVNGRLNGTNARIDGLVITMDANSRRSYNLLIAGPSEKEIRMIPKLIADHPAALHGHLQFAFGQPQYPIGALPPNDLVPNSFYLVWSLDHQRLQDIYWFYNDARLDPRQFDLPRLRKQLVEFLKYS